ncbi:MAG: hypothetical protein AB1724_02545 [Thermodesulfobacteriota bacterium]
MKKIGKIKGILNMLLGRAVKDENSKSLVSGEKQVTGDSTSLLIGKSLASKVLEPGVSRAVVEDKITKIVAGLLPEVPMQEINKRFVAGMRRTEAMGRPGLIQPHHKELIKNYKNWNIDKIDVMAEWITMEDDDVCEECKKLAREGPYPLDQALYLIPACEDCRCVFLPVKVK